MPAQTFSLRADSELLDRIDENATRQGLTRTAYVLSWLPETYAQNTETATETNSTDRR